MNVTAFNSSQARRVAEELRANWELASSGGDAVDRAALKRAAQDPSSPIHDAAQALLDPAADGVAFKFFDWHVLDDFGTDGGFFDGRITKAGVDEALATLRPELSDQELASTLHTFFDRIDLFGPEHGLDGEVHKEELMQAVELDPGDPDQVMLHRFEHSGRHDQLILWNALSALLETGRFDAWAARSGDPSVLELTDLPSFPPTTKLNWENP